MGLQKISRRYYHHHHHHHHERCMIPVTVQGQRVISGAVLLVVATLALLSIFAPAVPEQAPPGTISLRPHALIRNTMVERQRNAALVTDSFRVPSRGDNRLDDLWASKLANNFQGCSKASSKYKEVEELTREHRYLTIATSGGLNQQRTGITDAVVVARILKATLVVPKLDNKSFWKDSSEFAEIFDVDWFISYLAKEVKIIKDLPEIGGKVVRTPYSMLVPRKCTPKCYEARVLPALQKKHVVQLKKFDYRLSNDLDAELQKLRCRVNYHALKFTDPIEEMGETLIQRMRQKRKNFIALHLRFEPDMLAFSGCYYGGGQKEKIELGAIRNRWKTLHVSSPERERRHGKCPLTPEEVGLMLRALGFGSDVHIYVASGEIYGGEETLSPLKALFPNLHSKETLASKEELAPFTPFSSRMAALDFIVCDGSDVFVTNNNGNMAKILAGRRRYFGHKRSIRPNAKKLSSLFDCRTNMTWEEFSSQVRTHQKGFMGEPYEVKPGKGAFHENPSTCICNKAEIETNSGNGSISAGTVGSVTDSGKFMKSVVESGYQSEDEQDLPEFDFVEGRSENRNEADYELLVQTDLDGMV